MSWYWSIKSTTTPCKKIFFCYEYQAASSTSFSSFVHRWHHSQRVLFCRSGKWWVTSLFFPSEVVFSSGVRFFTSSNNVYPQLNEFVFPAYFAKLAADKNWDQLANFQTFINLKKIARIIIQFSLLFKIPQLDENMESFVCDIS